MGLADTLKALATSLFKGAPAGVGAGWGTVYRDAYRSRRAPTNLDLLVADKNIAYYCARLNAVGVASTPLRLYAKRTKETKYKSHSGGWFHHEAKRVEDGRLDNIYKSPILAPILSNAIEIYELADHRLQNMLTNPNPFFTRMSLIEWSIASQDIQGDAYWAFAYDAQGLPAEIWPLESHRIMAVPDRTGTKVIQFYEYMTGSGKIIFQPDELLHFRMTGLADPYVKGYSSLRASYENCDIADKLLAYEESVLDNRARPDMLVSPKESIGPAEALRLERKLQQKFRGGGSGGIVVGESGLDYRALVFPPSDLAALEIRKVSREELATGFGVPISLITSTDVNRANAEAGQYLHAARGILPRCRRFEEVLNQKLCPLFDPDIFFAFDDPVPENQAEARAWRDTNIKTGVHTINEERRRDGMPPIEGGDVPMVVSNFFPVDIIRDFAMSQIASQQSKAKPPGKPDRTPESDGATEV